MFDKRLQDSSKGKLPFFAELSRKRQGEGVSFMAKCPKCEGTYFTTEEVNTNPYPVMIVKCGRCDTAIGTTTHTNFLEILEILYQKLG